MLFIMYNVLLQFLTRLEFGVLHQFNRSVQLVEFDF